ncbi:MAG: PepSY domain-containing protein [Clostridia bacterium]|nr:PepSY domain-containing protein [Clostridia bacterium]
MDEHRMFDAIADIDEQIIDKCLTDAEGAKRTANNTRSVPKHRRIPWYAYAAAALALVFLGGAINTVGTKLLQKTVSNTVSLDVNPSIEIKLNRNERVVAVVPLNGDAEKVVGSMDFSGVPLDLAVNALIGSMVRNSYLNEFANSVLVTVDDKDEAKAEELTRRLVSVIDEAMIPQGGGAVIGMTAVHDAELEKLADRYGITLGKAMLINKVAESIPYYSFDELVMLNISELNMLLDPKAADVMHIGTPKTSIISSAEAVAKALDAAGYKDAFLVSVSGKYVTPAVDAYRVNSREPNTTFELISDLCIENGEFVYWVEFRDSEMKYDVRVNADGNGAEIFKCPVWSSYYGLTPSHRTRLVSENVAVNAVLKGIGASPSDIEALTIRIGTTGSGDRMITVYTIEFNYSIASWTAQVNAETGEVISITD